MRATHDSGKLAAVIESSPKQSTRARKRNVSTVLRISGSALDVDEALDVVGLEPCSIACRGERRFPDFDDDQTTFDQSCIAFVVSDAGFDEFPQQVADTICYLIQHGPILERLLDTPGIDEACLCFGVTWAGDDIAAQSETIPGSLIELAGHFRLSITLTRYRISDD